MESMEDCASPSSGSSSASVNRRKSTSPNKLDVETTLDDNNNLTVIEGDEQPLTIVESPSPPAQDRPSVLMENPNASKPTMPPELFARCPEDLLAISASRGLTSGHTAGGLSMKNLIALRYGATLGPNRMSYPREFKLMVVQYYYANGMNKYRTCKTFQITKSMLNGWLAKLDKIQQSRPGSLKSGNSGRRPQFPEIEQQLYQDYQAALLAGETVNNRWLRDRARALANGRLLEAGMPLPLASSSSAQFSERWLSNFKRRYAISVPASASPSSDSRDETPETPETTCNEITSTARTPTPTPMETAEVKVEKMETPQKPRPLGGSMEPGRRGRKVQFPQVERVLYNMYCERTRSCERISNRWLQEEARRLAVHMCPDVFLDAYKSARCMFSEHWLHNFKKRYNISLKNQVTAPNNGATVQHKPLPPVKPAAVKAVPSTSTSFVPNLVALQQQLLLQAQLLQNQPLNDWYRRHLANQLSIAVPAQPLASPSAIQNGLLSILRNTKHHQEQEGQAVDT